MSSLTTAVPAFLTEQSRDMSLQLRAHPAVVPDKEYTLIFTLVFLLLNRSPCFFVCSAVLIKAVRAYVIGDQKLEEKAGGGADCHRQEKVGSSSQSFAS